MKFLSNFVSPDIKITPDALEKLALYAKNMTKRGTILVDCAVDQSEDSILLVEPFLVPQVVDYTKNSTKYEEVAEYIGYKESKEYGTVYCQCMIRNSISNIGDDFTEKDFEYFERLCDASDWLIVGEITKPTNDKPYNLTLWFLNLETRVAIGYSSPSAKTQLDYSWSIGYNVDVDEKELKAEISEMCKEKTYGSSYSNSYGNQGSSYEKNYQKTDTHKVEKSKLNKEDPDLSKIV